jgi:hypothetical protein
MPLAEPPDLVTSWEYLYERSVGCVGVLKDWLVRGLATAIRQTAPTLTLKHLQKHALSVSQCDRLIEEAAFRRLHSERIFPSLSRVKSALSPNLAGHTPQLRIAIDEAIAHIGPILRHRSELGQFA